jgi:hypothetical protein
MVRSAANQGNPWNRMTVLVLCLLLFYVGVGVLFRMISLLIRLVVMIALLSAIVQIAGEHSQSHGDSAIWASEDR